MSEKAQMYKMETLEKALKHTPQIKKALDESTKNNYRRRKRSLVHEKSRREKIREKEKEKKRRNGKIDVLVRREPSSYIVSANIETLVHPKMLS